MQRRHTLALFGLVATLLTGCSLIASPDEDELGRPPQACAPGTVTACPCLPAGTPDGTQQCQAGGRYGICRCPPAAGSGG